MGVRYRKYFKQCKDIKCNGRLGKYCPDDRPRNAQNRQYRLCGRWAIELFDDNRKWQSLVFKDVRNRADAEKRLALLITDRERGLLNLPSKKKAITLQEYCDQYLESIKDNSTRNTYMARRRAFKALCYYLGKHELDKISPFMVEKYRIDRMKTDNLKPMSINLDIAALSLILNRAVKEGFLSKNPCKGLKPLKVEQARDRILSSDEIAILLDKLKGTDKLMVEIALFTGMRLNEVLLLKWDDIDFNSELITFTQSKTGKTISMPLSKYLANELKSFKTDSNRLFESNRPLSVLVGKYSAYFSKIFKDLGIVNFTYHNLRHTFASLHGSIGTDIVTTQSLLGHSDISQTMRYSHTQLETKRSAIDNITDYILKTKSVISSA